MPDMKFIAAMVLETFRKKNSENAQSYSFSQIHSHNVEPCDGSLDHLSACVKDSTEV